jgi:Periplasmic binding protein-like domain
LEDHWREVNHIKGMPTLPLECSTAGFPSLPSAQRPLWFGETMSQRLAVRHLFDLGHTDIAIIPGASFASTAVGRLAGATRALTSAGITPNPDWIIDTGFGVEHGQSAGHQVRDERNARPTAVFAANEILHSVSWPPPITTTSESAMT